MHKEVSMKSSILVFFLALSLFGVAPHLLLSGDESSPALEYRRPPSPESVTTAELLLEMAMHDESTVIRKEAAVKLDDLECIVQLALNGEHPDARKIAVEKELFNSQTLLAEVGLKDKDSSVRIAAVQKLDLESVLAKISIDDPHSYVCVKAAEKVCLDSNLANICEKSKFWKVRRIGVEKISSSDEYQPLIAKLASGDESWFVRRSAVRKLKNHEILSKILSAEESFKVRRSLVEAMALDEKTLPILKKAAISDPAPEVRIAAVARLEDSGTLGKVVSSDESQEVKDAAQRRLDAISDKAKRSQEKEDKKSGAKRVPKL